MQNKLIKNDYLLFVFLTETLINIAELYVFYSFIALNNTISTSYKNWNKISMVEIRV